MASKLKNTLEELDLTDDEINRFTKAFKDEEFRKLFKEYADEISDPENRKRYEEEIAKMEADRGMDVEFVHPKPGFVLKTTVDGSTKAFINVAINDLVQKPSHQRATEQGKSGLVWSIPHLFSHPREDLDKTRKECRVFDVVFHSDTYRMAESNARFRKLVEDTALDGIEKQFGVSLDKRNVRRPKMKYKGQPVATVIRKKKPEGSSGTGDVPDNSVLKDFPYPYPGQKTSEEVSKEMRDTVAEKKKLIEELKEEDTHTVPHYVLKYSQDLQLEDFGTFGQPMNDMQARSRRPERVVVEIDLPLIRAAGSLDLDISERSLTVTSEKPAAYKLTVPFSYPVQEDGGNAKFDKKTRKLVVTLPIVPQGPRETPEITREEHPPENHLVEELGTEDGLEVEAARSDKDDEEEEVEAEPEPIHDPYQVRLVSQFSERATPSGSQSRLPECSCREDDRFLSLLFDVRSVQMSKLKISRDDYSCFHVELTSLGSGGWPIDFSFFLKVEYQDSIQRKKCPFLERPHCLDTINDNFVVRFSKTPDFYSLRAVGVHLSLDASQWTGISVANDEGVKARQMLKQNLCDLFQKVSMSAIPESTSTEPQPPLSVSELSEKLVTIHLDVGEDDDEPAVVNLPSLDICSGETLKTEKGDREDTSPSIEVVFKDPPRQLHSILKKTSSQSSESQLGEIRSDEDSCCRCPSHGSADDIRSLHKSVSFSGRPEVTNFSVSQPVCSLHNTLKNRRRKMKRREQRRRLSSGSRSTEEDEVVAASIASRVRRQRGGEPRQRHYSDSILVTDGQDFIESDDFSLQESNENLSEEPSKEEQLEPPFETKKRRRKKKKETATDKNANHSGAEAEVFPASAEAKRTSVNWSDSVAAKPSSDHRTSCAISFSNSTIYELDDD